MRIAIAIETKDRRLHGGQNYLGTTLRNLRRAGVFASPHLHSLHIVSGGEQPDYFETEIFPNLGLDGHTWLPKIYPCPASGATRQQNAQRAIQAGADTNADWVLKLEDDLDFLDDFLGNVARWLADVGHAAVPMFCLGATFQRVSESHFQPGETFLQPGPSFPRVRVAFAEGRNVLAHDVRGWYGAQALLWKRPMAEHLARWLGPDPFLFDGREQHRHRGHDLLLQEWGVAVKARAFASAVPSFVQHIGRRSNLDQPEIGHVQPFFEFPWPGREWRYVGRQA